MKYPGELVTVRIRVKPRVALKKWRLRFGFVFGVDVHTPLRGGLNEELQKYLLNQIQHPNPEYAQAMIDAYNDRAKEHYGRICYYFLRLVLAKIGSFFLKTLIAVKTILTGSGWLVGVSKVSPFDISLEDRSAPCHLLYISETQNWRFRGGGQNGEIIEPVPPKNGQYPPGQTPDCFLKYPLPKASSHKRPRYFYLEVTNPGFPPHPDNSQNPNDPNNYQGFKFDIHMAVEQDPNQETKIIIDPKLRNP